MSRALDAAIFAGLDSLTGLRMDVDRTSAALTAYNAALQTLAPLDAVPLGETAPAAAFNAAWE
ncbi:hypothetical protein [Kineococcus sp. SYSU DK005]|uniref:hypothetical protein n=1 Tax=Kineococcus sp. SYSU DK005 TaxID=3383126 RepID=UPI003D7E3ED7